MKLDKNIYFMHVPKAGGSSVRAFIASFVARDDIFPQKLLHNFPAYSKLDVVKPMLFMSHFGYEFTCAADGVRLTLLRHPIERLLSLYSYCMRPGSGLPLIPMVLVEGLSIHDFFASEIPVIRMNTDNLQAWQIASGYAYQHRKLRLANGVTPEAVRDQAIANLKKCDFVGVLESVDDFYASIAAAWTPDKPRPAPRVANISERRILWDDLNAQDRAAIESCVEWEWDVYDAAKRYSAAVRDAAL